MVAKQLEKLDPEIEIDVYGDGPGAELIRAYQGNNLKFHGAITHVELITKLPKYALGLSFRSDSRYDQITFPVRIYEYIGAGLPVVCAPKAQSYTSEIEVNGLGYVFTNNEPSNMAEKIYLILQNPQTLRDLKENVVSKRGQFSRVFSAKELTQSLIEDL